VVKFEFSTSLHVIRLLTSSLRDFRYNYLMILEIVSTFDHLQFRLRGVLEYVNKSIMRHLDSPLSCIYISFQINDKKRKTFSSIPSNHTPNKIHIKLASRSPAMNEELALPTVNVTSIRWKKVCLNYDSPIFPSESYVKFCLF